MPEPAAQGDFAARFVPGLLDPGQPTPEIVTGPSGKAAVKRFNVYRNNVTASLVAAVSEVFPLTSRALGGTASQAAALTFVRGNPPTSKLLFEYGRGFDRHLDAHGFAEGRRWIVDLARLERAWLDAYHAADCDPLAPEALGVIAQDRLADAVFRTHPAARLVDCRTPAVSVMIAIKNGEPVDDVLSRGAETALITRPALAVDVRSLARADAMFFNALLSESPLGAAAAAASDAGDFDLAAALALALQSGAFKAVDLNQAG